MGSSLPPGGSGSLPMPSLSLHLFLLASGQDCGVQVRGTCLLRCAAPPTARAFADPSCCLKSLQTHPLLPKVSENYSQLLEVPFPLSEDAGIPFLMPELLSGPSPLPAITADPSSAPGVFRAFPVV